MPQGQSTDDREPGVPELLYLLHILDNVRGCSFKFVESSHVALWWFIVEVCNPDIMPGGKT